MLICWQVTEMSGDHAQRAYDRLLHAQEAIERQRIGKLRSDIARVTRDERLLSQVFVVLQRQISLVAASDISQPELYGPSLLRRELLKSEGPYSSKPAFIAGICLVAASGISCCSFRYLATDVAAAAAPAV